jgi:hypothetical protein
MYKILTATELYSSMSNKQDEIDISLWKDYANNIINEIDKELRVLRSSVTVKYRNTFMIVIDVHKLKHNYIELYAEEILQLKHQQAFHPGLYSIENEIVLKQVRNVCEYIKSVFKQNGYNVSFDKTYKELLEYNNAALNVTLDWNLK